MKKILLTTAVVITGNLLISANASNIYRGSDRESRKEIRKERREERRELWLHSSDPATREQFNKDFPDATNVSWKEGKFAEASFLDGAIQKTAYYDIDDALVGTTMRVDFSTIPGQAQQKINKKYPGYSVKEVILFDDNEADDTDMNLFATSFADEDNYFPVLTNGSKKIILKVTMAGDVSFFRNIR
jgi:hypothetical protein